MADGIIEEEGLPEQIFEHPESERTQNFLKSMLRF
jgi:polar amino acid transport system ATP-binding protein